MGLFKKKFYLKHQQESILFYFFSLCFPLYMFPLICVSYHVILLCISFLRGVLSILLSTYVLSFLTFHKNGPFPKRGGGQSGKPWRWRWFELNWIWYERVPSKPVTNYCFVFLLFPHKTTMHAHALI